MVQKIARVMNPKIFAPLFLSFIFCAGSIQAKTRQQVVDDAVAHENITAWTASTNTHVFASDMIFQTQYSTGVVYESENWPYVYGGREDDAATSRRINAGTCPGGAPKTGSPYTEGIYNWWAADPDNRPQPAQQLAGIDCNGFVMRMLGVTSADMLANTNAWGFRDYSVSVQAAHLKLGDVLISPTHIRMVTSLSPLQVSEATGGSVGRVITQDASVGTYLPYSPFPMFTDISPSSSTAVAKARPEIKGRIWTGTVINAANVVMKVDDKAVSPTLTTSAGAQYYDFSYTPTEDLTDGNHKLYIWAKNDLGLEDEIEQSFIRKLLLSIVGNRAVAFIQNPLIESLKSRIATISAWPHGALLVKRYTASYARGVALCPPLTRLASAPLARSRAVVARPARGESNLLCAGRSTARSRFACAARTPRNTASYPRDAARAGTATPAPGLPQVKRYAASYARVAVGGRTSGGQLPRSPRHALAPNLNPRLCFLPQEMIFKRIFPGALIRCKELRLSYSGKLAVVSPRWRFSLGWDLLYILRSPWSVTLEYICVVLSLSWPMNSWIYLMSMPFSRRWEAMVCLKTMAVTRLSIPAAFVVRLKISVILSMLKLQPVYVRNKTPSSCFKVFINFGLTRSMYSFK